MFDVGFWEISIIVMVALVVVGPERLPKLARTAGLYLGKARRVMRDVRSEIDREIRNAEMSEIKELESTITDAKDQIKRATDDVSKTLNEGVMKASESTGSSTEQTNDAPDAAAALATSADDADRSREEDEINSLDVIDEGDVIDDDDDVNYIHQTGSATNGGAQSATPDFLKAPVPKASMSAAAASASEALKEQTDSSDSAVAADDHNATGGPLPVPPDEDGDRK